VSAITFRKRGKPADTSAGPRLIFSANEWKDQRAAYRIEKSMIAGLPIVWRACVWRGPAGWQIISKHRTRPAAERAANTHYRKDAQR
jgi:hypothetical protein